jgi:hypothetical protein
MTTDAGQPEAPQDEIDVVQKSIDAEQTQDPGPQYATSDDLAAIRQLIQQQNASVAAQVNGLASKVDTGLNAIRRDTREEALNRIAIAEQRSRDQFLGRIAEENPELSREMKAYLEAQDSAAQQRAELAAQPDQSVGQQQTQAVDEQQAWNQVYRFVESNGISSRDSRVNYSILVDQSMTEYQRQERFIAHIDGLKVAAVTTPPTAVTTPVQPGPQGVVNPPREAGPAGARANFRSSDDIIDAYTSNQIDKSQAVEQLRRVDPELLDSLGWGRR